MSDRTRDGLGLGVVLAMALNVVGALLTLFLLSVTASLAPLFVVLGIGLLQLVWLGPLALYFRHAGKIETVKGIAIIAGITFLLNAACWGLVYAESRPQ